GAYQSAGDLGRAIPLFEQTLTDRVRVLGEDHPNTLTSRNNLAYARQRAEAVQHRSTATSVTDAVVPPAPSTAD
ncbi:tetratricopeptide repeat protein, partial [Streptomyces sp. NPDC096934]|uniref:tetratricopeptide repeat protein n=1 Tax=Streptomyces sp. NPDC096934 TaxID=3155551 RepID=UPI00332C02BF